MKAGGAAGPAGARRAPAVAVDRARSLSYFKRVKSLALQFMEESVTIGSK